MPTRDINEYLASGEADDYKKGGVTDDDTLKDKVEIQGLIAGVTDPIDARVQSLEAGHTVVLNSSSALASQGPTALDVPHQVTFGAAQETPGAPVHIDALGSITFNVADKYIINFRAHYGRTGATGTSHLLFRFLKNGIQVGSSYATKIDNANTLIPWDSSSFIFEPQAGDVLTAQLVRDSAGDNSGGLFQLTPTTLAWAAAPCAAVSIYKV